MDKPVTQVPAPDKSNQHEATETTGKENRKTKPQEKPAVMGKDLDFDPLGR